MFRSFLNTPTMTTTKCAGAFFIAVLISIGTASADDISKVTGNVGGKVPLMVTIVSADGRSRELGRMTDYKTGSFSIDLKEKVSKYHWQAFKKSETTPCDKNRDVTTSSIPTVPRERACEDKAPATGEQSNQHAGGQGNQQQNNATSGVMQQPPQPQPQQKPPPKLQLDQAQLSKAVDDAEADLDQVKRELDALKASDPDVGHRLETLHERYARDYETIVRDKTLLQGWASTSPIVTHPLNWEKIEQKSKDLGGAFKRRLGELCRPAGSVSIGDAGSNVPPAPDMEKGTPGQHAGGCKFNTNVGSWK